MLIRVVRQDKHGEAFGLCIFVAGLATAYCTNAVTRGCSGQVGAGTCQHSGKGVNAPRWQM